MIFLSTKGVIKFRGRMGELVVRIRIKIVSVYTATDVYGEALLVLSGELLYEWSFVSLYWYLYIGTEYYCMLIELGVKCTSNHVII